MISHAALAVLGGFSLNLVLSFALGAASISGKYGSGSQTRAPLPVFQLSILFLSVLFLWLIFTFVIPTFWGGFSVYFLLFPLSVLVCMGLEFLFRRFFPKLASPRESIFLVSAAYDGLIPASLMLTLTLAGTFPGALILSLSFAV
ncbi:MAG: hypothetical protein FWD91_02800, partial [Treponema sp.]|nr:hypothetical protein [Treponema sp.]